MTDKRTPTSGDSPPTPMTRRGIEARIIAKAWRDPKYKAALLRNPRAVLQRELAAIDPTIALPAGLTVKVHEETPDTYHLVLPRNPKDITLDEIVGDDLEAVAPQTIAIVVVGAVVVGAVANVAVNANAAYNVNAVSTANTVS